MSKKYRSDAMAAIHESMRALHDIGAIDKQTMRRFDNACLTRVQPLGRDCSVGVPLPPGRRGHCKVRMKKLSGSGLFPRRGTILLAVGETYGLGQQQMVPPTLRGSNNSTLSGSESDFPGFLSVGFTHG